MLTPRDCHMRALVRPPRVHTGSPHLPSIPPARVVRPARPVWYEYAHWHAECGGGGPAAATAVLARGIRSLPSCVFLRFALAGARVACGRLRWQVRAWRAAGGCRAVGCAVEFTSPGAGVRQPAARRVHRDVQMPLPPTANRLNH
eukprot:357200-Chlamydomonas_euryale.AAC.2